MLKKIGENSYFIYSTELDYLLAAVELLKPYHKNARIDKLFGTPEEKKYQVFQEIWQDFGEDAFGAILEPVAIRYDEEFTLDSYQEYLLKMDRVEFFSSFLQTPKAEIQFAMSGEVERMEFYQKNPDKFRSYLSVSVLFDKTEWLIEQFISFVKSLKSEKVDHFFQEQHETVLQWEAELTEILKQKDGLSLSEELMRKSFYHRGPYQKFYFMPAFFLPVRCCRWFADNQVLIFDALNIKETSQDIPKQLKALADPTRYEILRLLKQQGHMSGIEIAERMSLATSTISHHMSQMKACGLIHEEPAKNTKYYSLNTVNIEHCVRTLENMFLS